MNIDDLQQTAGSSHTGEARRDWLCLPAGFFSIPAETIFIDDVQTAWGDLRELGFRTLRDAAGPELVPESNLVKIDLRSASQATIVPGDQLRDSPPIIATGRLAGRSPGHWHRAVHNRSRIIVVVGPRAALSSDPNRISATQPALRDDIWVASVPVMEPVAQSA